MKPGISVRPCASMVCAPSTFVAAPDDTDTILPSRTTTEPRSMTPPLPSRMRALVTTRFCAVVVGGNAAIASSATQVTAKTVFIEDILPAGIVGPVWLKPDTTYGELICPCPAPSVTGGIDDSTLPGHRRRHVSDRIDFISPGTHIERRTPASFCTALGYLGARHLAGRATPE